MRLSEAVIQQFINGNLSLKDSREVIQLLEQNPEWVHRYFNEEEWNSIRETEIERLGRNRLENVFREIELKAYQPPGINRGRVRYIVAAAASVAAALITYFYAGTRPRSVNDSKNISIATTRENDTTKWVNGSDSIQYIALEDGSAIHLSPESSVAYLKRFPVDQRVIQLTGTAFFDVAKDKSRPFEVQASGFSTIALGTSFRVQAADNRSVTVQLYTGKVVVKQTGNNNHFTDVILLPDQQLVVDILTLRSRVSTLRTPASSLAAKTKKENTLVWSNYITDTDIRFANTPLTDVFRVVEHQFGIDIQYNPAVVKGMVFTGTFNKTIQAQNILSTVTSVNSLTLLKSDSSHFKITK